MKFSQNLLQYLEYNFANMQPVINFQYYALYVYIYLCTIFNCQLIYKLVYVYYILAIFFLLSLTYLLTP